MLSVFVYGTITLYSWTFQTIRLTGHILMIRPTTPASKLPGLGSSAFARRYLRNLC